MAMGENEQGFLSGGMGGAATGASVGFFAGGPVGAGVGAAVGFLAGGIIGASQSDRGRRARIDAEKEAERARQNAIRREMGAKQQAESLAFANFKKGGSAPTSKGISADSAGFIGTNLPNSSGTF